MSGSGPTLPTEQGREPGPRSRFRWPGPSWTVPATATRCSRRWTSTRPSTRRTTVSRSARRWSALSDSASCCAATGDRPGGGPHRVAPACSCSIQYPHLIHGHAGDLGGRQVVRSRAANCRSNQFGWTASLPDKADLDLARECHAHSTQRSRYADRLPFDALRNAVGKTMAPLSCRMEHAPRLLRAETQQRHLLGAIVAVELTETRDRAIWHTNRARALGDRDTCVLELPDDRREKAVGTRHSHEHRHGVSFA